MTHAVVLGAGIAGLLSAQVLTTAYDQVTLVERDRLPEGPRHRPGVPQSHHVHGLLDRGLRDIETLLPGFTTELTRQGAHVVDFAADIALRTPAGWVPRITSGLRSCTASRILVEAVIRRQVLAQPRITLHERRTADGLIGTSHRITAVRLRDLDRGALELLDADLVVDATGRASRTDLWLRELGCPETPTTAVDAHMGYATRWYRIPAGHDPGWRACIIQPGHPHQPRGATLMTVEHDRWVLTLIGAGADRPPRNEHGFLRFARGMSTSLIADFIAQAEPLSDVITSHTTSNVRHHIERAPQQPHNLLRVGDAACAFNPAYAQGMTMAAAAATLLARMLRERSPGSFIPRFHHRLAAQHNWPWLTASTADLRWPHTDGPPATARQRVMAAYADRAMTAATHHHTPHQALLEVYNLRRSPYTLLAPATLARALGPSAWHRPADPPVKEESP